MINATSTKKCPWYVVPADNKWYERLIVSRIVLATLEEMNPNFPALDNEELAIVQTYRTELENSIKSKEVLKKLKRDKVKKSKKTKK